MSVLCSIASTEHMGTQSQTGFHCFNTSTQQTLVVSGLMRAVSVTIFTDFQTYQMADQASDQLEPGPDETGAGQWARTDSPHNSADLVAAQNLPPRHYYPTANIV